MFFGLFNRAPAPAKPKARSKAASAPRRTHAVRVLPDASALQVTEGSEQSDWALWEDSVAVQDSQMQSLQPSVRLYRNEPQTPTEFQDIEAFARVRRKDP